VHGRLKENTGGTITASQRCGATTMRRHHDAAPPATRRQFPPVPPLPLLQPSVHSHGLPRIEIPQLPLVGQHRKFAGRVPVGSMQHTAPHMMPVQLPAPPAPTPGIAPPSPPAPELLDEPVELLVELLELLVELALVVLVELPVLALLLVEPEPLGSLPAPSAQAIGPTAITPVTTHASESSDALVDPTRS
jgi:hypothetical protein